MRNLIDLTDDQIEEAFDALGIGADIESVAFTRDTIDEFIEASRSYNERGTNEIDGNTLIIYKVQPRKGDMRQDLYVIDFGEVRGSYLS